MYADRVAVRHDLHEETRCLEVLDHGLSRLVAVHAVVGRARATHGRIVVQNRNLRQVVALAHLKVVRVVRWRNLHAAGSEFGIHIAVRNDRNLAVRERKL